MATRECWTFSAVHFSTDADPAKIPHLVRRCVTITGPKPWQSRIQAIRQQIKSNPLIEGYCTERYFFELEMEKTRRRVRLGQKVGLPETYEQAALFSFLAMVVRVYDRLSPSGRKRLAGMIRGGLKDETGLVSIQHEMAVATHLLRLGCDLTFHDIETGGGFDFLAVRDGVEIEIEAKTLSGDVGRKVHRRRLYQLSAYVRPAMESALRRRRGGQLARIILPGRLLGTDDHMQGLSEQVSKVLDSGTSEPGPEPCGIEYMTFALEGSPFQRCHPEAHDPAAIERFVRDLIGADNLSMLMLVTPDLSAVILTIESAQKDKVMDAMVKGLKQTAKYQLTGTRPGIICVRFTDVTEGQLLDIYRQDKSGKPSPLQRATSDLLDREDWRHVHTLAYLTAGSAIKSQVRRSDTLAECVQERGSTYSFTNPHHKLAKDERVALF